MGEQDVTVTLIENMRFTAHTPSGFDITMDSGPDTGGEGVAARPMEMQLAALGGCTAMDVISILRKMRQEVTAYDVTLSHERAPEHPRVYTSILLTHDVRGRSVQASNVRRAIELTMQRYCPVFAMLAPTVAIAERYTITDDDTGATESGDIAYDRAGKP